MFDTCYNTNGIIIVVIVANVLKNKILKGNFKKGSGNFFPSNKPPLLIMFTMINYLKKRNTINI